MILSRIRRCLAAIGAALAIVAGAVLFGWRKRGQVEAGKALGNHIETRKRVDGKDYLDDDIGAIRERLRERGER